MTEPRQSRWLIWTSGTLFLVLVVYPLSMGPLLRVAVQARHHGFIGDHQLRLVESLYAPVTWMAFRGPTEVTIAWAEYINWWVNQ
jgi:hypothetical protein